MRQGYRTAQLHMRDTTHKALHILTNIDAEPATRGHGVRMTRTADKERTHLRQ